MSIEVKNISYVYMPKSPYERLALDDVSITIPEGKITAIAGHTGSGKSTLIQHLNGLISPTSGSVLVDGVDIAAKGQAARAARRSVGMVFQYPEHQLFEETVEQDIAFGPKNYGMSPEEISERVRFAMDFVQLDYKEYSQRSPFQLSGGQMRRAAIAGVVALKPKYLVLDEPTAGLDPKGREELMQRIMKLHRQEKNTIILVSHSMDDIARFADNVVIMNRGRVLMEGTPHEVFVREDFIRQAGLDVPQITNIVKALKIRGWDISSNIYTMDEAVDAIFQAVKVPRRPGGTSADRSGGAEKC
ncbi:energy-coupling factor transporter ATPase [Anaerovibrio sp.]|uniref:energy-coupling factor transporter ATPase n=1 Tax=Anaerovibrio sp. TaxID=1872532 RepID=UPI00260EA9DD|nr:energy-coupling factor transporter ATPase [Anaerovibrio sp.]MDD6598595.1 energy-coupling factor transporter ATPase [Anaerovibrio sp.]MDD7677249.1 energy-coupling factor transporter ATPase [Anaerovibrio sp.]MDY2603444.1 energy-coupling factor transporter ATPase [Anaerovibrio sp.]